MVAGGVANLFRREQARPSGLAAAPGRVLNRRAFGVLLAGVAGARANIVREVDVGARPQLFLHDDRLIESKQNLRLVLNRPRKHAGGPVLVPDRPWELGDIDYSCFLDDRDEGLYKVWYEARENNGILGDPSRPERGRCMYATSKDGLHWEKPSLRAVDIGGSRDHNVVFTGPSGQRTKVYWIVKDYAEPDPERRYKMMYHLWDFRGRGLAMAHSPDGIHWTGSRFTSLTGGFDSQNMFLWDDRIGQFAAYVRSRQEGRRCLARSTSPDGFHWSAPVTVHCPDAQDPPRFDLYTPGVIKLANVEHAYVMLTAAFDWDTDSLFGQLALSRDGIRWHRFREPFLPLGATGDWDSGSIYPVGSEMTVQGKTAIYYRGNSKGHGAGGRPGIGVAFLQMDAFAGWRADGEGTLTTPLLHTELLNDGFFLNAQAAGGSIEVELRDAGGAVLPGYSRADAASITRDGASLPARWKSPPERTVPVRLKLYLRNATVYGFQARRLRPADQNQ